MFLSSLPVFDASTKFPRGVLSGNVYNMGDFDECLGVRGPSNIKGQYCLSRVDITEEDERRKLSGSTDPYTLTYDPLVSAWEKIESNVYRKPSHKKKRYLRL
ncbi:hypothetical protein J437_LFUL014548 [Ladona fulva]|uniref:Nose resistant-to-fluoxetine protein N-terminal domain-containing protein n=1 Tax=Ladona fulva TaxID=123851 RepID=A0A8K0KMH6_LADFU|nr:hypothetical protein J437_LFUL014548 [Ladona fulva]